MRMLEMEQIWTNLPTNEKTALRAISNNKRDTAALHIAAGRYMLVLEVVHDQLKSKRHVEQVQKERENKRIDAHTALANKVMQSECKTNSQHRGQWSKRKQWQRGASEHAIFHYQ